ncbi:MAG: hypothetical protein JWM27_3045 [Gemmatimonadetes bacterium]|nr:hypothetical protein [Gemmatimonadota bacterium]
MSDPLPPPPLADDELASDTAQVESATVDAASSPAPLPVPTPERPLGDIALSLSGGGYRAAGFHLGVLGFLDRVGLLKSVSALSTVSGGSIVGAAWVTSVLDGVAFAAFRDRFRAFLRRTNVIGEALRHLVGRRRVGHPRWPSLIGSAAHVYSAPGFLGERKFAELYDPRLPLREVIFNSTEFHTGVDFRFRRSDNPLAKIGNGNVWMPREVANHVRLADVVAASSCFPGAFEPFQFPDEFAWPADYPLAEAKKALGAAFEGGLPLMDGGIYDNQGVESLVLAYDHGQAATLLISDTSPRQSDFFTFPAARGPGWVTIRLVNWLGWALFALALLSFGVLLVTAMRRWTGTAADWLLYVVPGALALSTAVGLGWLHHRLKVGAAQLRADVRVEGIWADLRRLTVGEAAGMAELRASSLIALTSSVFMKRIRSLVYKSVFQDPRFEQRRMACLVYGLEESRPKLFGQHPWLRPNPALVAKAKQAEQMATALWFDDPAQLDTLEEVGAATICLVLIKLILEDRAAESAIPGSPVADLLQRLRSEWDRINAT